jgi:putative ABC transport system permease protein
MLANLLNDLRAAWRGLIKHPGFALIALLILALGMGANTAIFSIANGVLLRPLGYQDAEQLLALWPADPVNKLIAEEVAARDDLFAGVSAYVGTKLTISGDGRPALLDGARVSAAHFEVLGRSPLIGRTFAPGEDRLGNHRVAVLGYGLWQRRYGGDEGILGRGVLLDGERYTVAGVMPADFLPLERSWQMWVPLTVDAGDEQDYLGSWYLSLIARLRPGFALSAADTVLREVAMQLQERYPNLVTDEKVRAARAIRLQEQLTGNVRPTLLLLLSAVGCVLLIACANVANLVLTRSLGRSREFAMRTALGASRRHLIQQLLVEGLLIGLVGAVLGLVLVYGGLKSVVNMLPAATPRAGEIEIDATVLVFNMALALFATLLFGLWPAYRASRVDIRSVLQSAGTGAVGHEGWRIGKVLVTLQVAAATLLLIAAGLLAKSLWHLRQVDPGFRADGLLTLRLDPSVSDYPDAAGQVGYYERILERLRAVPGVSAAGAIHLLPMTDSNWRFPYVAEGHPIDTSETMTALPDANFRIVTPGYFTTMRIPLVDGRELAATDHAAAAAVGIVNRALAERWWPGGGAVGKTLQMFGEGGPVFTIVGVVENVRQHRLDGAPEPELYRPLAQWANPAMYVMLRTELQPDALIPDVRAAAWSIDEGVPISELRPAVEVLSESLADQRFVSYVIAVFAVLSFTLGMIGLYGVIAYTVARRNREIGIRMALGEERRGVLVRVVGQGLALTGIGIVLGVLSAFWLTRLLTSRLYEVQATDAGIYVAVAATTAVAAVLSSMLPAWRASRVDPVLALRDE